MPSFRGQMCRDGTEELRNKARKKVEQTAEYICWSKRESKCLRYVREIEICATAFEILGCV